MLKALLRVRLLALGSWLTGSSRKKKAQSKLQLLGFAALMLYALAALGMLFWHLFSSIAEPFNAVGLDWLYFAMLILMAFGLMFVGSVFTAKAQLFEARDNDLLLSMPIKPGAILLSRMFMLAVIAFVLELIVFVPAGLVWASFVGFSGGALAAFIIAALLVLLLALSASSLFGWLISLLTARVQKKALFTTVLSIVFLLAYMYVMFNLNTLITGLAAKPDAAASALGAVEPIYKLSVSIAAGKLSGMVLPVLVVAAIFAGTYYLLSATFAYTAAGHRGGKKQKYVERVEKVTPMKKALFNREMARFLSCPAYILNSGMGIIMTVLGAAFLLIKTQTVRELAQIPDLYMILPPLAVLALCLMSTMTLISAPSVSLEGRSIWIAQTIPVDTRDILKAKLRLHNVLSVPILFACAAAAFVLELKGMMLLWTFVLPALTSVFMGLLGLAENLRHPNLDWINETQAVKSGVGALFTMFISWGLLALPVIIYVLLPDAVSLQTLIIGFTLLLAVLSVLLYRSIMGKGVKVFESL